MYKEKVEELEPKYHTLIMVHDAMVVRVQQLIKAMEGAGIKIPAPLVDATAGKVIDYPKPASGHYELTEKGAAILSAAPGNGSLGLSLTVPQLDYIYRYVTARAERDPAVLRVITSRPEIQVHVTAKTLEVDESEPTGAIALLIHEKFFDGEGKNGNAVCKELIDRRKLGFARRTLYDNLETVARMGFLVHEGKLYRATGRKVTVK